MFNLRLSGSAVPNNSSADSTLLIINPSEEALLGESSSSSLATTATATTNTHRKRKTRRSRRRRNRNQRQMVHAEVVPPGTFTINDDGTTTTVVPPGTFTINDDGTTTTTWGHHLVVVHNNNNKKKHDAPMTRSDLYFALDCEMVGIGPEGFDSAVARVTIVNWENQVVLDTHVQVPVPVTDYRTHISGIQPEDLDPQNGARTFDEVRDAVSQILKGKILIGHGLENDLCALGLTHPWSDVRDTACYQPFMRESFDQISSSFVMMPRKLRDLVWEKMGKQIQDLGHAHCPKEDAIAALDLYKLVRNEWEQDLIIQAQQHQQQQRKDPKSRVACYWQAPMMDGSMHGGGSAAHLVDPAPPVGPFVAAAPLQSMGIMASPPYQPSPPPPPSSSTNISSSSSSSWFFFSRRGRSKSPAPAVVVSSEEASTTAVLEDEESSTVISSSFGSFSYDMYDAAELAHMSAAVENLALVTEEPEIIPS